MERARPKPERRKRRVGRRVDRPAFRDVRRRRNAEATRTTADSLARAYRCRAGAHRQTPQALGRQTGSRPSITASAFSMSCVDGRDDSAHAHAPRAERSLLPGRHVGGGPFPFFGGHRSRRGIWNVLLMKSRLASESFQRSTSALNCSQISLAEGLKSPKPSAVY